MNAKPLRVSIQRVGDVKVPLPSYQTAEAVGLDLHAALAESLTIGPGKRALVRTGIALSIPAGYEGQVRPRSGLARSHGISIVNTPGTIDPDYRGEVSVVLINLGQEPFLVEPLARIAQLVITPVMRVELDLVEELDPTARGSGGYGSTGV
jgi:dUTP pyrophosphatase